MPIPNASHFYKYRSCQHPERLEQIILQHELYFPTAAELNDPAECRPRIVQASLRDRTRFLIRQWRRNHPDASLLEVATQFGLAQGGLQEFGDQKFQEHLAKAFYENSTQTRIFSMSKRWDHMAQWAKYAENHTGHCLEFANADMFEKAREVEYGATYELDVTSTTAAEQAIPLFFRKTPDWSNEEEVRIVGPTIAKPVVPFDPKLLTRIILGKNISPDHEKQIRAWALARKPTLTVVRATYDVMRQVLTLA